MVEYGMKEPRVFFTSNNPETGAPVHIPDWVDQALRRSLDAGKQEMDEALAKVNPYAGTNWFRISSDGKITAIDPLDVYLTDDESKT